MNKEIESSKQPGLILMSEEISAKLSPLYSGEELGLEAVAQVKYFAPDSSWTWYATEFDGEDTYFGLVAGIVVELGYFSLQDLRDIRGPLGMPIERDLYYQPTTLEELLRKHKAR